MRPSLLIMVTLSSFISIASASALEASDTMQAWKTASPKERSDLLEQLLGDQNTARARISQCMTETSAIPGHADLSIGEVAKACTAAGAVGQPV